ncbi:putative riboflavin kinase [Culicoides brevitarsis]|uniref:putative riboflavin kinase n=1 Tax=Culicoides brevitarsis TaxID=469753 RepID=UPI00307B6FA2
MKDKLSNRIFQCLPYFVQGEVVKGFGRGSKQLGIPTANLPMEVVRNLPKELDQGVYYGWANVDNGDVHKVVLSIGWNPFYDNKEKSMESHIMHDFGKDFYGSLLKVCILGHIRPELNFDSLEALIEAINNDIAQAKTALDEPEALKLKNHAFFKEQTTTSTSSSCESITTKTGKNALNVPNKSTDDGAKGI